MNLRPLPRSRLVNLIPSLVQSQALVALVAATGELRWAAEAAWDVARAAAATGRRVALVDLWVEEPLLHTVKDLAPNGGIVAAFESGASLTESAQEVGDVFFIATGATTAAPDFLLAHPRWKKLQAGFRSEGALLLVFLSAAALSRLSAVPDGVIVLAPEGVDLSSPAARGLMAAQEDGATLVGVVRERWTPPPMTIPDEPLPFGGRTRRGRLATILGFAVLVLAAIGWALTTGRKAQVHSGSAGASGPTPLPVPSATPAASAADTAPWTIQLAAYGTADKALAQADRLAEQHFPAVVTPVVTPGKGTVWYRVLAGAYATREAASAARDQLWDDGIAPRGEGDLLRAPYTLALTGAADVDSLHRAGIPVVRLGAAGRLVVGAYETPEQAAFAQQQLAHAGLPAALTPRTVRTEITP